MNRNIVLFGVAAIAISRPVRADSTVVVEGTLVSIDSADLVIDLGSARGMSEGETVELWRPIRVKHPVTGKLLVDRFRIGSLRLGQVQRTLSFARPDGDLSRQPLPGDVVLIRRTEAPKPPPLPGPAPAARELPAPSSSAPSTTTPPPPPAADATDPEARLLSQLFDELRGKDPRERVRRYQEFAAKYPDGRFAAVLREEAAVLSMPRGGQGQQLMKTDPLLLRHAPPDDVRAGMELRIAFLVDGAHGGVLHVKSTTSAAYVSLPMREVGPGYLVATVPSTLVTAPGMSYFAEATDATGRALPLYRTADAPQPVDVDDVKEASLGKRNSTAALFGEYAFYGPPSKKNDYVFQTEGYFGTRFQDVGVRALRSGFGVFRGAGGSLKELDEAHASPRKVGLTYGYVELEYAVLPSVAFVGRGIVGLRDAGVGGGAQGFVRIGSDRTSNLLLGGEVLGGVGLRGIAELSWKTIPRVPIVLRTEVTNQPAGTGGSETPELDKDGKSVASGKSEVGARAIAQVGYQLTDQLEVAVRASYQGRTINHAGPGFGGGVTYTW